MVGMSAGMAVLVAGTFVAAADDLAAPVCLRAAGQPIDVEVAGHAAPFVADLDHDGRKDLLVGELFDGRLRIYRNAGTNAQPKFEKHEWFLAEGELGRIPSG